MNKKILAIALAALLIGVGGGYWLASRRPQVATNAPVTVAERKPIFYRNPMNPAITSPVPAQDEMGMDYLPVYADEEMAAEPGTVKIDPTVVQNIGVRTTEAKRTTLTRTIRTIGRITYDEQRVLRLHPKYDGWVEKLFIDKTGDWVKKGDMLLAIYSPQLVATQQEYLLALKSAEELKNSPFADVRLGAQKLLQASIERLQRFDVPPHQIAELTASRRVVTGTHIHAPLAGVVMNIGAREGERITPDTELYTIADLSHVWVMIDLYETEIPWVRVGDHASLQVAAVPGRIFEGRLTHIYPYLDAKTRTVKARLEFDNADHALKPDMFGTVVVHAERQVDAVTVPSEAIVRSGTQEQVFVQRAPGHFEPRKVITGVVADGQTQIVSGLEAGEIVVTSGQFLIDSESKLKEATAKMLDTAQGGAATRLNSTAPLHDMSQHDMSQHDMSQHDMSQHDMSQHDMSQHDMSQHNEAQHDHGGTQ